MAPVVKRLLATCAGLRPRSRAWHGPRPRSKSTTTRERTNGGLAYLWILRVEQYAHSRGSIATRLGDGTDERAAYVGVLFDSKGGIDCGQRGAVLDLAQRPGGAEPCVVIGFLQQMRKAGDRTTIGMSNLADRPCGGAAHLHAPIRLGGARECVRGRRVAEVAERPGAHLAHARILVAG